MINDYLHKNSIVLKYGEKESKYRILLMGAEKSINEKELKIMIKELINKNEKKEWILDEAEMNIIELYQEFLGNKIQNIDDILELIEINKMNVPEAYLVSYILKMY